MASQVFDWDGRRYDISRLLADIENGDLRAELIDLCPSFVGKYGQKYLVRGEAGRVAIDMPHVLFKSPDRLHQPAVLLHVGKDRGLITFDEELGREANWVIGDGNHRILAAGLQGIGMKAYCLTEEQTTRYEIAVDDPPGL
jgi:hypothetical protein